MRNKQGIHLTLCLLVACVASGLVVWSCDFPSGEHVTNSPPRTRLANVPANDTIARYINLGVIPEQTLYWVGDDPDGYVTAYRFRWIDYHRSGYDTTQWRTVLNLTVVGGRQLDTLIELQSSSSSAFRVYNFLATLPNSDPLVVRPGGRAGPLFDSLASGRWFAVPYPTGIVQGDSIRGADPVQLEAPNKGIFIFDSPADSNQHRFEVKAVDNEDVEDPAPPFVHFWTLVSPSPIGLFIEVPQNNRYLLRHPTEILPGLRFRFGALDPSTFEHEYSWAVDDTLDPNNWSPWSSDGTAIVTGSHLRPLQSGTHSLFARVRNRWGAISPTIRHNFVVIVPEIDDPNYPRRILLVNNNRNGTGVLGNPTLAQVTAFYSGVLDSLQWDYSVWVTTQNPVPGDLAPVPPRDTLSRYRAVIFVYEHIPTAIGVDAQRRLNETKQAILRDYLSIGGNLIYVGSPNIQQCITGYETWGRDIFHVAPFNLVPFRQNTNRDLVGSKGLLGYPDIRIDSTKLPADSAGALRFIAVNPPRSFGETISLFDSKLNDPQFEDAPLGIRYLAVEPIPPARKTWSVVHFGFPLFYSPKGDVYLAFKRAYEDIFE
jgi:hypothetical protein